MHCLVCRASHARTWIGLMLLLFLLVSGVPATRPTRRIVGKLMMLVRRVARAVHATAARLLLLPCGTGGSAPVTLFL